MSEQRARARASRTVDHRIAEGIDLFNTRKFFEAHEALEAVWLTAAGDKKVFLHGLIQIAAAFHHQSRGNARGFRSLLEKGSRKLAPFAAAPVEIELAALFEQLQPWRDYLDRPESTPGPLPPLPVITLRRAGLLPY